MDLLATKDVFVAGADFSITAGAIDATAADVNLDAAAFDATVASFNVTSAGDVRFTGTKIYLN